MMPPLKNARSAPHLYPQFKSRGGCVKSSQKNTKTGPCGRSPATIYVKLSRDEHLSDQTVLVYYKAKSLLYQGTKYVYISPIV
jgi:hypothetical protein